jgi:hypothetical protein
MNGPLTCLHQDEGLCLACQADYDEDASGWLEYGQHLEGQIHWQAVLEELATEAAAFRAAEAAQAAADLAAPAPVAGGDEIPF